MNRNGKTGLSHRGIRIWTIVLYSVLLPFALLFSAGAAWTQEAPREALGPSVVTAIDENYLYAKTNPQWTKVRQSLLSKRHTSAAEAAEYIARQLSLLGDSDLNLFTGAQFQALQTEVAGQRIGIGLVDFAVDRDPDTGMARVVTPTDGSPAALAGMLPGDLITRIDDQSTKDMSHEKIFGLLRREGEHKILISRDQHSVSIRVRASTEKLEPVRYAKDGPRENAVGYIRVVQFTPDVSESVRKALTALADDNVTCLVLDLRNNPGGLLSEAQRVGGLFGTGALGSQVRRDSSVAPIDSKGEIATDKPLTVLINEGTASAAELLAASLGESGRATLVGTTTRGRGQVQTSKTLSDGFALVIPVALLRTAQGHLLKEAGVQPRIEQLGDASAESFSSAGDKQYQAGLRVCRDSPVRKPL